MRISDWSSDVCSSDLADRDFHRVFSRLVAAWVQDYPDCLALAAGMIGSRQGWHEAPYVPCPAGFAELGEGLIWADDPPVPFAIVPGLASYTAKIGRASCRDRVGP